MKNALKVAAFTAASLFSSMTMAATAVDLSSWVKEGTGTWNLEAGNNAVKQTVNGNPTIFHNNMDSQGLALSGTIEVQTTSDDDFVGFVLGYDSGEISSSSADYILIDWKQGDQNYNGLGQEGLSISRVSGVLGDNTGAWAHDSANNVTELQRATTLGDTGWDDNTEYAFDLIFTSTLIEVFVNGNKELSISGVFDNGSFGFYNYSQANVRYAGIEETVVPPSAVPIPAAGWLLGSALMGLVGMRRKQKAAL